MLKYMYGEFHEHLKGNFGGGAKGVSSPPPSCDVFVSFLVDTFFSNIMWILWMVSLTMSPFLDPS